MKNTVYLGLGSNVGDKTKHLMNAIDLLEKKLKITKTSKIYISKPVGFENQDLFLNMVIEAETNMDIKTLFKFIKDVEKMVGRVERFRWGPREIDIDILLYNSQVYNDEELSVPHPRVHERDFVLVPLVEINPDIVHPVLSRSAKELLEDLKETKIIY